MKKIKYISFSLIALLVGILCISFIPTNKTYAETSTYEADIVSGNAFLPDYAVTDVEKISYSGNLEFKYNVDSSLISSPLDYVYFYSKYDIDIVRDGCYSFFYLKYDFSNNSDLKDYYCCESISFRLECSSGKMAFGGVYNNTYWITISPNNGIYSISILFEKVNIELFDNLSYLVDMNSDTFSYFNTLNYDVNYSYNNSYPLCLYNRYYNNSLDRYSIDIPYNCINSMVLAFDKNGSAIDLLNYNFYSVSNVLCLPFSHLYSKVQISPLIYQKNIDFSFNIDYFNIDIYKPTSRMKNTLIIYNYDSNGGLLSYVKYCDYILKRRTEYFCIYSGNKNNLLSNPIFDTSQYFMFYNKSIENMLFDEYITLNFYIDYSELPININDNKICFTNGFDFNFVQYTQPLVASNGTYNYTFEKPKYVDMPFSLVPFYIPVLEMCQNALIFLVFYCPLISDILSLIYLDKFFGALLQIINFVIGIPLGSFILACVGFIIYYMLLKTFMPVLYSTGVAIYHNSNGYRYRQEKKQAKKEWKYQKYKDKKLNKQITNVTKKNKK